MLEQGFVTGASNRNWESYGHDVTLQPGAPDTQRKLLTDPQTAGGLLVACAPDAVGKVMDAFARDGFKDAAEIGVLSGGSGKVVVA
jgi:selenide,water dikinase